MNLDLIDGVRTVDQQWKIKESYSIDIKKNKNTIEWIVELVVKV